MQHRQNNHRISRGNSSDSKPGVHTITLSSGLTLRTVRRTAFEVSQTKVQISKGIGRGQTPYERLKTRQYVVHALEPQLAMSGITKLSSMSELSNYNIAKDVLLTEHSLLAIQQFARAFDMESIFVIPDVFDTRDPISPHHATQMSNLLTDWKTADKDNVLRWQEFVLTCGSDEDVESNRWMQETLFLSMEPILKAAVLSDLQDVPTRQRGAVTAFYLAICRVAVHIQEAKDLLLDWVRTFDLRAFANQNVSRAALHFKAVVRMIGERELPANTVHHLLRGMSQATNTNFQQLCTTTEAMLSISSYRRQLGPSSKMKLAFSVLHDLENRYLELLHGRTWEGVGHDASAFVASKRICTAFSDDVPASAVSSKSIKHPSSFSDWVKTKYCHHCGEIGHIRPICRVLLRNRYPSPPSRSKHVLNINHVSRPRSGRKRRSGRETLWLARNELCQDTFHESFVSTASNAKNIERSTFRCRFVKSFVEAFRVVFSKSAEHDQVYLFRHHFPTAVADVVTYIGSSSLPTIESMIRYYKRIYVSAYASIFHEECTESSCDLASSLNSQFRRLFGKAFAEDDSLRELFDQQDALSPKSEWELKPRRSVESHWRAATAYAASSFVDQHCSAAGVSLAVYHIVSSSAFTSGPALSSKIQTLPSLEVNNEVSSDGSSPQVDVVPSVNIAPLVSSTTQHIGPTSISNGNVQCAVATIAVPSYLADKPSLGQDVSSNTPVVLSTSELEESHVPSTAPTKPSISKSNVLCFAAVERTPSHNTLVSSYVSNVIVQSVPSPSSWHNVYLNGGKPSLGCPHLRKGKVSAVLVPISQLRLSNKSCVPTEYDFGRPPPWPDPAGLILAMCRHSPWPDPVGLLSVPYCWPGTPPPPWPDPVGPLLVSYWPGTLPPPWPDSADWTLTLMSMFLSCCRTCWLVTWCHSAPGRAMSTFDHHASKYHGVLLYSPICSCSLPYTQDDRRVQYGLLQWEQQSKPTAILKKKHATYLCLSKLSLGHIVASAFNQMSSYIFRSNVGACAPSVSSLHKAVVAVRNCTSLSSSGSMYAFFFKQWEQSPPSVTLCVWLQWELCTKLPWWSAIAPAWATVGACMLHYVSGLQWELCTKLPWWSAIALAWATVGATTHFYEYKIIHRLQEVVSA